MSDYIEISDPTTPTPDTAPPRAAGHTLLLRLDEAARELRCTRRTLERQIAAHRLPVIHIGRAVRIERTELEAFLLRLRAQERIDQSGERQPDHQHRHEPEVAHG